MRPIARVRPKKNVFDINDNVTDDDRLMLFDVMDGRRFFKKTPQSLTKHTFSIANITSVCATCLRRQHQAYCCRLTERSLLSPHGIPLTGCTHMSEVLCGLEGRVRHRAYARRKRASILYSPEGCCITHFAARSAPLAKVSRLWDRCTSSRRSPG